jgi:hypothetical protein
LAAALNPAEAVPSCGARSGSSLSRQNIPVLQSSQISALKTIKLLRIFWGITWLKMVNNRQ